VLPSEVQKGSEQVGPIKINHLKLVKTENNFFLFACFYNQVSIYEINFNLTPKLIQEIIVEDFGEDIGTLDVKNG
jgi:hypothetical protein